jgi:hypothetical protein
MPFLLCQDLFDDIILLSALNLVGWCQVKGGTRPQYWVDKAKIYALYLPPMPDSKFQLNPRVRARKVSIISCQRVYSIDRTAMARC